VDKARRYRYLRFSVDIVGVYAPSGLKKQEKKDDKRRIDEEGKGIEHYILTEAVTTSGPQYVRSYQEQWPIDVCFVDALSPHNKAIHSPLSIPQGIKVKVLRIIGP